MHFAEGDKLSHNANIFMKATCFPPSVSIPSHVCTIFPPSVCRLTPALNTYGLSGRTYANTWGQRHEKRSCSEFWSPLGLDRAGLGHSDLLSVIQTEAVPLTQQQGEFWDVFKLLTRKPHFPPAAPQTMPSVLGEGGKRKPGVAVEIPCFSQGQSRGENICIGSGANFLPLLKREVATCNSKNQNFYHQALSQPGIG